MVVNQTKEKVWGGTARLRRCLHSAGFDPATVVAQVKDLGVSQGRHVRNVFLDLRVQTVTVYARKIWIARQILEIRKCQTKALVFAAGLYGVEVNSITQAQTQKLRWAAAQAAWGNTGPRNRVAALLLLGMEPWVEASARILCHWQKNGSPWTLR